VAVMLKIRALTIGETLGAMEGRDEEQRNEVERLEKSFSLYTKIISEFSDEKKPS
jgi:hypothetical protein